MVGSLISMYFLLSIVYCQLPFAFCLPSVLIILLFILLSAENLSK